MSADEDSSGENGSDSFLVMLDYSRSSLEEDRPEGYPGVYGNVEFVFRKNQGRHQFFTLLKSSSDLPVAGGLGTLAFVGGYGNRVMERGRHTLLLGASLALSDWGIETGNGTPWPVLPLPYVHYEYLNPVVSLIAEFITSPMLEVTLGPGSRFRFNSSLLVADASAWDEGGIQYDANLEYRFFPGDHEWGDFAGLRAGFRADEYSADLSGGNDESLSLAWNSLYTTLDLSFLEITGGYAFGKSLTGNETIQNPGDGFFMSLQFLYVF